MNFHFWTIQWMLGHLYMWTPWWSQFCQNYLSSTLLKFHSVSRGQHHHSLIHLLFFIYSIPGSNIEPNLTMQAQEMLNLEKESFWTLAFSLMGPFMNALWRGNKFNRICHPSPQEHLRIQNIKSKTRNKKWKIWYKGK